MIKPTLISIVLLAALTACASGPKGKGGPPRGKGGPERANIQNGMISAKPYAVLFTGYDTNNDRLISADEIRAGAEQEWAIANPTQNDRISVLMLNTWKQNALGHIDVVPGSRQFDTNGDYSVTAQEFNDNLMRQFVNWDKNKDGVLSRDELLRTLQGQRQDRQRGGERGNGGRGGPPGGEGRGQGRR